MTTTVAKQKTQEYLFRSNLDSIFQHLRVFSTTTTNPLSKRLPSASKNSL